MKVKEIVLARGKVEAKINRFDETFYRIGEKEIRDLFYQIADQIINKYIDKNIEIIARIKDGTK